MGGVEAVAYVGAAAQGAFFAVLFVAGIWVGKLLERRAVKKRAALEKEK